MSEKKDIILSASMLKVVDDCSYLYYLKYVLKLPDKPNLAGTMGGICHTIFESLVNKRHKHYFDLINERQSIIGIIPIEKLIKKLCAVNYISYNQNVTLLNTLILEGLKHDFYFNGADEVLEPEYKFNYTNKNPRYTIRGFIDLMAKFQGKMKIRDYKSGRSKFTKEQLKNNVQAMCYALIAKKVFKMDAIVDFIFLKHPKKPIQTVDFTQTKNKKILKGFEQYLAYITEYLQNFTEEHALSNFAADSTSKKGFCIYVCGFREGFDYWELQDKDGKQLKTSRQNDLIAKEGELIVKKSYSGCPRFPKRAQVDNDVWI